MLHFDIDIAQVRAVAAELGASEKQIKLALHAALNRTATSLRTMASRALASELQLRTISLLRKRLKTLKLKVSGDGVGLWFGLNDMPASWFKGTPSQDAAGASMRGTSFAGAFVAKSKFKGRKTIFKRTSKKRLHIEEQNLPIADSAVVLIEDNIFDKTEDIFWKFFQRDLAARVNFNIGAK